jgi:hypothetical protein
VRVAQDGGRGGKTFRGWQESNGEVVRRGGGSATDGGWAMGGDGAVERTEEKSVGHACKEEDGRGHPISLT